MITALLLALTIAPAQPAAPGGITLDAPQSVAQIDTGKIKGDPLRLSWSPDSAELFLMSADRDRMGNIKGTHGYLIKVADKSIKSIDQEPDWSSKYWSWKSGQVSPAAPAFRITVEQGERTVRAVSAPTGGALARGGTADPTAGTTMGDIASAANTAQTERVVTLKAKGEPIGEWVNQPVVPGVSFSWAPAPRHLLVYTKPDGGSLMTLDDQGHKGELQGAKDAVLPAFSEDGAKLAWLEKKDKKHYELTIAGVK
jgi:hypothetical protein